MKKPFFAVVIPTYNRAAFIKKTIESVLEQTYQDFEVIVVDDGSTDETEDVVRSITDQRIKYHKKINEERGVARNTGANISNGAYITFFDSDDLLYDKHLFTAKETIEKYNNPEIFHLGFDIKDTLTGLTTIPADLPEVANERLIEGNYLSCNGVFVRRDIAAKHPFNTDRDLSGTEDYELWLRLASLYPVYCNNEITSTIVQHDARSVVTTDRNKLEKRIGLLEKYLLEDKDFVSYFVAHLPQFKANNRIYIALHLALAKNDRIGAISYLFQALSQSPLALRQRAFYGTIKRLFV